MRHPLDDPFWARGGFYPAFRGERFRNDAFDTGQNQAYRRHASSDHGRNRNEQEPFFGGLVQKQEAFQHTGSPLSE
jgi:hypothetical protein